jgi:hypothetical protein
MKNHILNTTTFTIRTENEVLSEVVGIQNAIKAIDSLKSLSGVGVFYNGGHLKGVTFSSWAKNINKLINK